MKTRNNVVKMGVVASAAALALGGAVGPANAGIITSFAADGASKATIVGSPSPNLFAEGSDQTPGGQIVFTTNYSTPGQSPVGIFNFAVSDSDTNTYGSTTEYTFTITTQNNTGTPWQSFNFSITPTLSGLNFDTNDSTTPPRRQNPSSPQFGGPADIWQPTYINWTTPPGTIPSGPAGGNQGASGNVGQFTFAIDVPNGITGFQITAVPNPEPGTWAMMAVGLIGLAAAAWRKKRQDGPLVVETPNLV